MGINIKHGGNLWLVFAMVCFTVFLIVPMLMVFWLSVTDASGEFVGGDNFSVYINSGLLVPLKNTLFIGFWVTCIVIGTAFIFSYALNRTNMPFKRFFKTVAFMPILAPSLMPAISIIYLFGNQGLINKLLSTCFDGFDVLMGYEVYGSIGIVMGLSLWCFPHAVIILNTSLSMVDQRLYEASASLKGRALRNFWYVTLPSAKYGLVSAVLVVFTYSITDFGVPKVVGGQFNVLATDIYKQVIGQQNFQMGGVVSVVLLFPALVSFFVDRYVRKKQKDSMPDGAAPFRADVNRLRDLMFFVACSLVVVFILVFMGMAIYASLIKFWPYNLNLTLENYRFDLVDGGGWNAYFNSLKMALGTSVLGVVFVVVTAYVIEKTNGSVVLKNLMQAFVLMPMAIPGLVLGLAYIFMFNHPDNPLNVIYQTLFILIVSTVIHYYTVSHMTATTVLRQIDSSIESASASLKVPAWLTFIKVTLPISLPAVLDIGFYYFVSALSTVSVVVFLYGTDTQLASVAVLNMDDAGDIASAAAMATLIFATSLVACLVYAFVSVIFLEKTQKWRHVS